MKIIVNATNIRIGGGLQVSYSIINELKEFSGHEYHIFLSPQLKDIIDTKEYPPHFHFYQFQSNPSSTYKNILFFRRRLAALERKIKPDFVFSVFGPALWTPKAPHLIGFANVILFDSYRDIIINKLRTFRQRMEFRAKRNFILNRIKKEGDLFWVEIEYAKQEMVKKLLIPADKITVISNTYSNLYADEAPPFTPYDKSGKEPLKLLYLTSYYPHKNLEILSRLIPLLHQENINCRFYLTLPETVFKKIFRKLADDPMLVNMGPVKPKDAPALYKQTDALFMPTLLEFFSASYPEAMKMKKPILTSRLPFAEEVCGNAALYFDPFDENAIAEKIQMLINDTGLQAQLVENGTKRLSFFDSAYTRTQKLLNIMSSYLQQR